MSLRTHKPSPFPVAAWLFVTLLLAAGAASAQDLVLNPPPAAPRPRPRPALDVSVELADSMGHTLRSFRQGGQMFVLGTPGERYAIRVRNNSAQRIEAVLSIDGRDAVSGQASDGVTPRGYLVPAFSTVSIEGFRTSLDSVAAFRFSDPADSYAALMGTPARIGEIALSAFVERPQPVVALDRSRWRRTAPPSAPRGDAAAPSAGADGGNLGTGFGEELDSQVSETAFERAMPNMPSRTVRLRYDDANGLVARGIDVFGERMPFDRCPVDARCGAFVTPPGFERPPQPPPEFDGGLGFAPPPPNEGRFATPPPGF